jgi:NAD(P)-dependent dehydrogenase (short-subunit alcohol dehydrogenase family)
VSSPLAVITAAAHRGGKRIADVLVDDGWDIAFWGMAVMRSRAASVVARGHRAAVARGNIADPASVRFMLATTRETFDDVDAVVHIGADHLAIAVDGSDPSTEALVASGDRGGRVPRRAGLNPAPTVARCRERDVEAVVIDATQKVHELAPLVQQTLATRFS